MYKLTHQRLVELLRYDAATGDFYWRISPNARAPVGAMAGKQSLSGPGQNKYRVVQIGGERIKAHRLVWFLFHGEWPRKVLDHVNGNTLDNRIENLRDVTSQQNSWNIHRAMRNSRSGVLGVDWVASRKKWRAQIRVGGRKMCIGYFSSAEEAGAAYQQAKNERRAG
jgi:predicted transcriptional regulator